MKKCPYCEWLNDDNTKTCLFCGNDMPADEDAAYPWFDQGKDFIIDKQVPADVRGHGFIVYYYKPFTGYGLLQFTDKDVLLMFYKDSSGDEIDIQPKGADKFSLSESIRKLFVPRTDDSWWSIEIPFSEIQNITLNGRNVELFHSVGDQLPFKVRAASPDGERLYRELYHHYPQAVSEWVDMLRERIGRSND